MDTVLPRVPNQPFAELPFGSDVGAFGAMAYDLAALSFCMSFFLARARAAPNEIEHSIAPYKYSSLSGFDDNRSLVRTEEG